MIARKYIEAFIIIVACLAAIFLGSHIVTLSIPELSIVTAIVLTIIWVFLAGDYWWLPVLIGIAMAGVFRIGFKVYPADLGFALAIIGLAPLILVQYDKVFQSQRKQLPFIYYLVVVYITIRLMIDIVPAAGSKGNLLRILFNIVWPFCFAWLFHYYGKLSVMRVAIGLVFIFLCLRVTLAIVGYVANIPLYIPGINYVLSFSGQDSLVAMRSVAFLLFQVSLILFHSTRSLFYRALLLPIFALSGGLVVASASRFATFMMLVLPVAFFIWARNWLLLSLALIVAGGAVGFANVYPHALDELPVGGRALSGLIFKASETETEEAAEGSNLWHSALRAESYRRWTQSAATFFFGYGIRPSAEVNDVKQYSYDMEEVITVSSNLGSYESSFWTVIALFGTVGFLLYTWLFVYFLRETLPYFLQKPQGTFWEGMLFWGVYSTIIWFATSNYQGGPPVLEVVLMVMAVDMIQEGKIKKNNAEVEEDAPVHEQVIAD